MAMMLSGQRGDSGCQALRKQLPRAHGVGPHAGWHFGWESILISTARSGSARSRCISRIQHKPNHGSPLSSAYNGHVAIVNNVTRMLDAHKIKYKAFELPDKKLSALETARFLATRPELIFKTIVVARQKPKHPLLVLVPGTSTVDLKKLAAVIGEKKVYLPTEREAERITGLQAGGISPLALINKGFRVLIDSSARELTEVHVSGGQRGLNIRLPVVDLVRLTHARLAQVRSRGQDRESSEVDPASP